MLLIYNLIFLFSFCFLQSSSEKKPLGSWRRTDLRVNVSLATFDKEVDFQSYAWTDPQQHTAKQRFFNKIEDLTQKLWFDDVVDIEKCMQESTHLFCIKEELKFDKCQLRIIINFFDNLENLFEIRKKENSRSYQTRHKLFYESHYAERLQGIRDKRYEVEDRFEKETRINRKRKIYER